MPVVTTFQTEPPGIGGTKLITGGPGGMTDMNVALIYGKIL